ncbi:hypothetical protein K3553_08015 [Leisingera aquaemixtae]|uniref:hypothetical protein n=1 Tax=Leisingera aquaemixtae TaxID=1396826 RepID=UPI0021A7BB20|nr:hypothetical protein [Leisingera aquaemixtae]UWQ26400.1 hypothetical protein K3553_08015 [Leisingera aquaemixtae]
MKRTVADLAKALLNATLILLALCLFLGWKLMAAAAAVTAHAEQIASQVAPLHTAATGLREDLNSLRPALQDRPGQDGAGQNGADTASTARLDRIEERLDQLQANLAGIRQLPLQSAEQAGRAGAAELVGRIIRAVPLLQDGSACPPPPGQPGS